MREKTEERRLFNKEERKRILKKSNGKCAHCGKALTLAEATVDHVIPLNKGGSNDEDNLVILCYDCNLEKSDDVLNPAKYYKYLSEKCKDSLKFNHEAYCEDVSWLNTKQYTKEDRIEIRFPVRYVSMKGHRKTKKNGIEEMGIYNTAVLSKVKYNELNDIREYLIKYHKKMGLPIDDLDNIISKSFKVGCIYQVKKGNEIICVLPARIQKREFTDDTFSYVLSYTGIPVLYQKPEYLYLVQRCIETINNGLVQANGKNIIVFEMFIPEKDEFLMEIANMFSQYGYCIKCDPEDGWVNYIFNQRWSSYKDDTDCAKDPDEDLRYFSKTVERIMKLCPANKPATITSIEQKQKKKNNALNKERKRINNEIDEYDMRYYI